MTFIQDAEVIEIKADFDPSGNEYAMVCIGFKLPSPPVPPQLRHTYPPPPVPVLYKHILHIYIPKNRWKNQYKMWEKVKVVIKDDGALEVHKVEG